MKSQCCCESFHVKKVVTPLYFNYNSGMLCYFSTECIKIFTSYIFFRFHLEPHLYFHQRLRANSLLKLGLYFIRKNIFNYNIFKRLHNNFITLIFQSHISSFKMHIMQISVTFYPSDIAGQQNIDLKRNIHCSVYQ